MCERVWEKERANKRKRVWEKESVRESERKRKSVIEEFEIERYSDRERVREGHSSDEFMITLTRRISSLRFCL